MFLYVPTIIQLKKKILLCSKKAHQQGRRAENHLNHGRFDEAIEAHQTAADLLQEAISNVTAALSLESLKLQRDYHLKAKDLVRMKRLQFEKFTQTRDEKMKRILNAPANATTIVDPDAATKNPYQIQVAIYNKIDEADTLLEKICSTAFPNTTANKEPSADVTKRTKGELVVIEELRAVNHQLHLYIYELMSQLDESNKQQQGLCDRIRILEKTIMTIPNSNNGRGGGGVAATVGEDAVMKELTALSLTTTTATTTKPSTRNTYSELPPLDLPKFDFDDDNK